MKKREEVPVYLFTGFLESGKTSAIQESLEDYEFNSGERTLVLVCESGEREYEPEMFACNNVVIEHIESREKLTKETLESICAEDDFERVMVEFNGMWMIDEFEAAAPDNWVINQEMTLFDSRTFELFNMNMRNLIVDKLKTTELTVFRNFTSSYDKLRFHKIVKATNRQCTIVYEYEDGTAEIDNIVDEMPFDKKRQNISVDNRDYAYFYTDLNENPEDYEGKHVEYCGICLLGGGLDPDELIIGRHIMTCCAEDIEFGGLVAEYREDPELEHGKWIKISGIVCNKYNNMYGERGPVIIADSVVKIDEPPADECVATFF